MLLYEVLHVFIKTPPPVLFRNLLVLGLVMLLLLLLRQLLLRLLLLLLLLLLSGLLLYRRAQKGSRRRVQPTLLLLLLLLLLLRPLLTTKSPFRVLLPHLVLLLDHLLVRLRPLLLMHCRIVEDLWLLLLLLLLLSFLIDVVWASFSSQDAFQHARGVNRVLMLVTSLPFSELHLLGKFLSGGAFHLPHSLMDFRGLPLPLRLD